VSTRQRSFSTKTVSRWSAAVFVALQASLPVQAQAPKVDSAEAAAAMERAQRSAANPLRAILQAGKLAPMARTELTVVPQRVAMVTPTPAPSTSAPVPVAATQAPVAASVVASAASWVAPTKTLESRFDTATRLSAAAPAEVIALETPVAAVAVTEQLSVAAPSAALASSVITPKLVHRVDPTFPQNLADQASQLRELKINFNIATDGSVSDVVLQSSVPRQLLRYVQAAVSQWRFEPLPAARAHQVQLVFGAE
jgi:hypothetical protein